MAMTGRRVAAEEALAWGLVNRVVPQAGLVEQAAAWARELAGGPPLALAAAKALVGSALDAPVPVGLEREMMRQRRILASADFIEAVTARVQKRMPNFRGS
jgi:enoyl-CoA hydratase/carnithine racemase